MRDTESTWERHCDIPRTDKTVRVTEWITKQIEWRKYVTNGYNNNSTENSLSKRLNEWVSECVYVLCRTETERAQQNEHATARQCGWMVVCGYMLASVYARDILLNRKTWRKVNEHNRDIHKSRRVCATGIPIDECVYVCCSYDKKYQRFGEYCAVPLYCNLIAFSMQRRNDQRCIILSWDICR